MTIARMRANASAERMEAGRIREDYRACGSKSRAHKCKHAAR